MTPRAEAILDAVREYCAAGGKIAPWRWNVTHTNGRWVKCLGNCPICPLAAYLFIRQPPITGDVPKAVHALKVDLGITEHPTGYVTGFTAAIDQLDVILADEQSPDWGDARTAGYADGLAVREALVAEGLLTVETEGEA